MARVYKICEGPSMTRQEFKDSCDLGLTLKRFSNSQEDLDAMLQNKVPLRFEDVTQIPDYRQALDTIIAAKAKFMALPADVRRRFNNDPADFVDFCTNPDNLDELRKLGLANSARQDAVEPPVSDLNANAPKNSEGI